MKKNKTIAYMLAATLLVGGTFLGTKALFTDQTTVAGELKISTGDLDIEVIDAGNWTLDRNGEELKEGTSSSVTDEKGTAGYANVEHPDKDIVKESEEGNFANNLKPGDVLTKTVTIENKGTLLATNVTVNEVNEEELYGGLLKLTSTKLDKDVLKPGDQATFKLVLKVNNVGGNHGEGFNTDDQENAIIDLDRLVSAWELNATQQNPKNVGSIEN